MCIRDRDEIQELHRGLASLKYFCEEAREYHVAVAGSLLGLTLHQGESYPVGKANTLEMFPMTYEEFLLARGFKQRVDLLQSGMWDVVNSLRTLYIQHLREYYLVGGMPEAVKKFIDVFPVFAFFFSVFSSSSLYGFESLITFPSSTFITLDEYFSASSGSVSYTHLTLPTILRV